MAQGNFYELFSPEHEFKSIRTILWRFHLGYFFTFRIPKQYSGVFLTEESFGIHYFSVLRYFGP